jgi:hypothetical protein
MRVEQKPKDALLMLLGLEQTASDLDIDGASRTTRPDLHTFVPPEGGQGVRVFARLAGSTIRSPK